MVRIRIFVILILFLVLAIYLNRSYARIYDRNEAILPSISWNNPILFKNPNFQNTVKYISLGDSLTIGFGSNDIQQTYPYILARNLSKNMSVSLFNFAERGATSSDLINSQLEKAVLEQPNYISIFIGINDVHNLTAINKFEEDLSYIIAILTEKTPAKILILNIPYLGSKRLILFPYNIYFDYRTVQFNKIILKIASEKNLTLVDLYTPTKQVFSNEPNFYSYDNFHPSGNGYILWGQLLSDIK